MANRSWYPIAATIKQATERQTAYVNSEVHLFKSDLVPVVGTPLADFVTNEADYDAYAAITIAAWTGPILAPGSGSEILSPAVLFEVGATDPVVGNTIGGFWLQDADGDIRMVGIFDPFLPMQLAYQAIPLNILDLFPTGFTS